MNRAHRRTLDVVALLLLSSPVQAQTEINFWWEGQLRTGATYEDEYQVQYLAVSPNASDEARLALAEIGVSDFVYWTDGDPGWGYFMRETASGTPPIGGSTGELIAALSVAQAGPELFWSTWFTADCLGVLPWPYVEVDLAVGTTSGQAYQLAQDFDSTLHAWIDTDTVLLRPAARGVFELAATALAIRDSAMVEEAQFLATWTNCACGCPSGDPTGGGGVPTIPPAAGAPSPLEIPTVGRLGTLVLGALLLALGLARLRV